MRQHLTPILMAALLGIALFALIIGQTPWPLQARDYLQSFAPSESGATNIVSAIYLGYRAFDTLGETLVLVAAVLGTALVMKISHTGLEGPDGFDGPEDPEGRTESGPAASRSTRPTRIPGRTLRTRLIPTIVGKLAPVVLLYGFYVMFYGHLSPGGGFQGGVILASGIIFLGIGSTSDPAGEIARFAALSKIEAVAFTLLIGACLPGMSAGTGFLGNPAGTTDPEVFRIYIVILNTLIGIKVGAGIGLMCLELMGKDAS